jgi:LysR family transcriptional regulator, regulator for metE and metH
MADLEIKHLRMIQMIAMTNNLTKAAEKLFVSQPALSQQLINIEERIGAKLFLRNGKNMVLTKIGNKLLNSAHIILNEIEKVEQEVAQEVHGETGELKIGIRCVFCFKWVPSVVKQFQVKYPNIDIIIANSLYAEEALMSKKYDLAITSTPSPLINNKVSHIQLFEDELVCVMSTGHPLSHRKHLCVEDFEGVDYIALTDTGINYFRDRGVNIRRFMTIPYPETIVDLVETGLGIALLPRWYVYPYTLTKNIRMCRFTTKRQMLQWNAYYLKNETIPSYQDEFIKTIISHAIVE